MIIKKKFIQRKEMIFFIFLIIIVFCFLIDSYAIYKSTIYTGLGKENRELENKFRHISNILGTSTVQMANSALIQEISSIDAYLHWMDTKNISYLEEYNNYIIETTNQINQCTSIVYKELDNLNETIKYESLANENETKSSKINTGLQLMSMGLFFFSFSIVPLRLGIDETEKKYNKFRPFGQIIFTIGLLLWSLGFIPIFTLLF